ncbi:SCO1 protein [Burkholderiales bacterium]|nr:MAG: SCO family protein [Burkholderiales bacterium]CAG0961661.1 SCO1 protein [Burkholderiales bacterium]
MRRVFLILCAALALVACSKPPSFKARDVTGLEYGAKLELPDHHGKLRSLADFKGKVVVVFFGYTHCPDVCPTNLADLAGAMSLLGADAAKVQVLFVTVDPERDQPEMLARYVTAFHPSFLALRGDPEATRRTATDFKVFYEQVPGKTPETYTVNHSTGSFIYDSRGKLRLYASHGIGAEAYASDLRQLLD